MNGGLQHLPLAPGFWPQATSRHPELGKGSWGLPGGSREGSAKVVYGSRTMSIFNCALLLRPPPHLTLEYSLD